MKNNFLVSIVIPVYNEQKNITALFNRLLPIINKYNYEVIIVDDGSKDNTFPELKKLAKTNKQIKLLSFTRNFGHQTALICGYEIAKGDCIVTLDADLQDPPEIINQLISEWQKGSDIVYAKRKTRNEGFLKKFTAWFFYRFINILSDTKIPTDIGDFRLQDKKVNDFIKRLPEQDKFLRGLVAWSGYKSTTISFNRDKRHFGKTNYTLSKMLNFALAGITSFSVKPLRLATYIGFLTSLLGILYIFYALYVRFFLSSNYWVQGWTTLIIAILFIGGIQLITIGIIGEYISKIYKESQNRPQYLLKEKVNL